MKKLLLLILAFVFVFSFCACNKNEVVENDICAFVKEVKENIIVIDIAEYITIEDTARMRELNLTNKDMPDGYHIHNPETELKEYTLTNETIYNFIDWKNDFVEKGENREVSTTSKEDFIKYLNTYENSQPGMPFFFDFSGNKVISITEIPMM